YDSGEFTNLLNKAVALADWDGFAERKEESRARGKLRGRGISDYLELTGPPGREMGGIRFEPNGAVTIITGTLDYGQGHWSPFAQVLATRLGIPFQSIRLIQGDSDELIAGGGTGGSKSMIVSGNAIVCAAEQVVEAGRQIAAIEVDPETGIVDVVKYTFVNDFGVVINPLLVDGQAHGGIVQGIGQALRECTVYDEQGQLLTGSYMDYAMPRAEDAPPFMH